MGESGGIMVVRVAAKALQWHTVVFSEGGPSWMVEMVRCLDSDHERLSRLL